MDINKINRLVEAYISDADRFNEVLKQAETERKNKEKAKEVRETFITNVLGPKLYKKYVNHGAMETFAPVYLSGVRLTHNDFEKFFDMNGFKTADIIDKVFDVLRTETYKKNDIKWIDNGKDKVLFTNITFNTFDDMIDFFHTILKTACKCAHKKFSDMELNANWKPITAKFKIYLK